MDSRYFTMSTSIIDRQDLSIYEKMCAAVLSRYVGREEFDNLITLEVVAMKMGVEVELASTAIEGLLEKKLLSDEYMNIRDLKFEEFSEAPKKASPKKTASAKASPTSSPIPATKKRAGTNEDEGSAPASQEELIQMVYGIINEKVNSREARIILNFANNDIELIREKYKMVKNSQIGDKVELLMSELQKKPKAPGKSKVIKAEDIEEKVKPSKEGNVAGFDMKVTDDSEINNDFISEKATALSQVNINKIQKLKAYQEASIPGKIKE